MWLPVNTFYLLEKIDFFNKNTPIFKNGCLKIIDRKKNLLKLSQVYSVLNKS